MFENEYQSRLQSLKPFIALFLVVMGSAFLVSCGGGDSATNDPSTTAQSADGSIKTIQAVSGSATVPGTWKGRVPVLNTSGAIPFNPKYAIPTERTLPADKQTGLISNQYWVQSARRADLDTILKKYKNLSIVAWREDFGYVIEVNQDDRLSIADLSALQRELGINNVYERSYAGPNAKLDYGGQFNPSSIGASTPNWHLNYIEATRAWSLFNDIANASSVKVGVIDSGLYKNHPEIRTSLNQDGIFSSTQSAHGTEVIGTIAGSWLNSDAFIGVAPMAKISFGLENDHEQYRLVANQAPRVINSSWGLCNNDDDQCSDVVARKKMNPYRGQAELHTNILHVWGAGNSGINAKFQNGSMHFLVDGTKATLDNMIIVGAVVDDGNLSGLSDYGESVDIAAPTAFRAPTSYDELSSPPVANYSNGRSYGGLITCALGQDGNPVKDENQCAFNGTSASAPIISGVATLMMSRNSALTAPQVKQLLIATANRSAKNRYTSQGALIPLPSDSPLIPIVNAAKAVQSAAPVAISSLDYDPTTIVTGGGYIAFRVLTDSKTAPAQKIEIALDDGSWSPKFDRKNGVRDSTGNFYDEIYNFSTDISISAGNHIVHARATDVLGRQSSISVALDVPSVPVVARTLLDDFNSTTSIALDPAKWTSNPYKPGYGDPTVGNGLVHLANCQSANTAGKVTFSGNRIVIKARFVGPKSWGRDTYVSLIDSSTGSLLRIGDSNYWNGIYLQLSKSGNYEVVKSYSGTSTSQFQEYRITLEGKTVTIERGDTLAAITKTITEIMPRSVTDGSYYVQIGTGGCDGYYSPADFDWIQVNGY